MATLSYNELKGKEGANNKGGYKLSHYIPTVEVDTYPAILAIPITAEDEVTYAGDFVFVTPLADGFRKMYQTEDTGMLDAEIVGEIDGESYNQVYTFFVPGDEPEKSAFFASAKNDRFIVLVEDCETGKLIILGDKCRGVKIIGKFNSGTENGGRKGWDVMVAYNAPFIGYYSGALVEQPI